MGSCTWFVAVSGDGLPRENNWREGERVCCCAVWRRTGRRKESYNVGVPTTNIGNKCLQDVLTLDPVISLIALFCSLNTLTLSVEFPQNVK